MTKVPHPRQPGHVPSAGVYMPAMCCSFCAVHCTAYPCRPSRTTELVATLESAADLCEQYGEQSFFSHRWHHNVDKGKFDEIIARLDRATIDLQLGIQVDTKAEQSAWRAAQEADR